MQSEHLRCRIEIYLSTLLDGPCPLSLTRSYSYDQCTKSKHPPFTLQLEHGHSGAFYPSLARELGIAHLLLAILPYRERLPKNGAEDVHLITH